MPETSAVESVQDTLVVSTETVTPPESTPSETAPLQTEPKLFFGKYKTEEEAEKAFKEAERKFFEKAERVSQLEKETTALQERSQLGEVLSKLAELSQKKEPQLDYEKFAEEMATSMAENPAETTKKLLRTVGTWTQQDRDAVLKELRTLREEMGKVREDMQLRMETVEPFYEAHKEHIDKLVKGGMNINAAKSFLKEMLADTGTAAEKRKPPVTVGATVATSVKSSSSYLTAEDRENFKAMGLNDKDLVEMEMVQRRNEERYRREKEMAQ